MLRDQITGGVCMCVGGKWGTRGSGQASKKKLSWEEEGGFIKDGRGFLYVVMVRAV